VVAIGTALGEFRHTVTTGVVSGLGRGITAGDGFSGAEKLDNVIQTDAAINPGNSGGPLLNSAGQVIGVNVAVSQSANNIGFALPINVVKNRSTTLIPLGLTAPSWGALPDGESEQGILNSGRRPTSSRWRFIRSGGDSEGGYYHQVCGKSVSGEEG
jgi:S1-C subfamily serine protease